MTLWCMTLVTASEELTRGWAHYFGPSVSGWWVFFCFCCLQQLFPVFEYSGN